MRIWDSLFSDVNRFDFLLYICCAMIMYVSGYKLKPMLEGWPSILDLVSVCHVVLLY